MAANSMPTLGQGRVEAGVISLLDPPFGTDLEETLGQEGTPVWQLSKRRGFDPQKFVRLVRVRDRVGPYGGSTLLLHLQGLAQRAASLDKHGGPC
jgi:hypothetical protein